jgi:hypothetical protein
MPLVAIFRPSTYITVTTTTATGWHLNVRRYKIHENAWNSRQPELAQYPVASRSSLADKAIGARNWPLTLCSVEDKNIRSNNSTPPYILTAWCRNYSLHYLLCICHTVVTTRSDCFCKRRQSLVLCNGLVNCCVRQQLNCVCIQYNVLLTCSWAASGLQSLETT